MPSILNVKHDRNDRRLQAVARVWNGNGSTGFSLSERTGIVELTSLLIIERAVDFSLRGRHTVQPGAKGEVFSTNPSLQIELND